MCSTSVSTVTQKNAIKNTIPLFVCDVAVLENARVVSRSRPAGYDISNEGIAITDSLDVDGVKLLSVYKCHSIFFVWAYDPDVGTVDGPDHTWKVPSIIELSLYIIQVLRE